MYRQDRGWGGRGVGDRVSSSEQVHLKWLEGGEAGRREREGERGGGGEGGGTQTL